MQKCHLQNKLFLSAWVSVCVCVCAHIKTWNCVNYPNYTEGDGAGEKFG